MSRDTSGLYTLPAGNPVSSGTTITSTWANNTLTDIANALSDSLSRSGNGGMTAPLRGPDGTVGAPAFSFTNENSLGFYRLGAAVIAASGALQLPVGSLSNPALQIGGAGNGLYSSATNTLNLVLNGQSSLEASPGNLLFSSPTGTPAIFSVRGSSTFITAANQAGLATAFMYGTSTTAHFGANSGQVLELFSNGLGSIGMCQLDVFGRLKVGSVINGITTNLGRVSAYTMLPAPPSTTNDAWQQMSFQARGPFGGGISLIDTNSGWAIYSAFNGGQFFIQSGVYGGVCANGVVLNGTGATSWSSASDERLKVIEGPIESALDKVNSLRAVRGRFKKDAEDVKRVFLIAQDVQAVLPEAVAPMDDAGHLALAYTDLIPLLVAAVKELAVRH